MVHTNNGTITMSVQELGRFEVISKVADKWLSQKDAAKMLSLSTRQIRRLLKAYREFGAEGIKSKRPTRAGRKPYTHGLRNKVLDIIAQNYYDFGPTLVSEKLSKRHNIKISKETARQWMIEAQIWHPKNQTITVHQPRARRKNFGELIQIDGSIHPWFEDRGPKCTLLVFIDDATSTLQELRFVEAETTNSYFQALQSYLLRHGKPAAIYSDKHGVFKVNTPTSASGDNLTQFGRALKELGIESIFAHSPAAKGRVERANKTLQDRLVKELRLNNISDIASANAFIEQFRLEYNNSFAVVPEARENLHRNLNTPERDNLGYILSKKYIKKVSKHLTIQHHNIIYKLSLQYTNRLRYKKVTLLEQMSGKIKIYFNQQEIPYESIQLRKIQDRILNRIELNNALDIMPAIKPPAGSNETSGQPYGSCGGA
jgi:transposase